MAPPSLILASASPRRRDLLRQIGVPCVPQPVSLDERPRPGEAGAPYVIRLARAKAEAGWVKAGRGPVLGSDTALVQAGRILGKPEGEEEAVAGLLALSGRWHQVLTAVALTDGEHTRSCLVATEVLFRRLSEAECRHYWQTGEPRDKAGGYAIQGLGSIFVSRLEGSYSAVVGLPLKETAELLQSFGVPCWQPD